MTTSAERMSSFIQQLVVPAAQSPILLTPTRALWSKTGIICQQAKAGARSGVTCRPSEKSSLKVSLLHCRAVLSWARNAVLGKMLIFVSVAYFLAFSYSQDHLAAYT